MFWQLTTCLGPAEEPLVSTKSMAGIEVEAPHDVEEETSETSSAVSIDTILGLIGEFGAYQRKHYVLVASAWIACSWVTLCMVRTHLSIVKMPRWLTIR